MFTITTNFQNDIRIEWPDGRFTQVLVHEWGLEIVPNHVPSQQSKTYKLSPSGFIHVEVWREEQLPLPL